MGDKHSGGVWEKVCEGFLIPLYMPPHAINLRDAWRGLLRQTLSWQHTSEGLSTLGIILVPSFKSRGMHLPFAFSDFVNAIVFYFLS